MGRWKCQETMTTVLQFCVVVSVMIQALGRPQEIRSTSSNEELNSNLVSDYSAPPLNAIQKLMKILEGCGLDEQHGLKRVFLTTSNITCNDGSNAGFYLRKSHGSKRWVIFLEGGWYCYDQRSCHNRWMRLRHLMTSKQWPEVRNVGGILSSNPEENPFWWNTNHVFVPYCTSDSWSGSRSKPSAEVRFTFMGANIVQQVIRDLLPLGLKNASTLLLAGSSAGGTGVIMNLDPVKDFLHKDAGLKHIQVRGVSDSGWFLDRDPYSHDSHSLAPLEAIKRGLVLWQGQVPDRCKAHYSNEPWRCYFGYRIYPTLSAPLFVFQWLFDEAQMTADNVGAPVTKQQWDYIHKMGDSLRNSFLNVTAVFAPSCISHSVLTKRDWQNVKIDEISLPHALRCWEMQPYQIADNCAEIAPVPMLGDAPSVPNVKLARNLVRSRSQKLQVNITTSLTSTASPNEESRRRRRKKNHRTRNKTERSKNKKRKGRRGNRRRQQRSIVTSHRTHNFSQSCQRHLIERCSWPQCNHSCPKLHNPFTGEEMDFIELLKSFGLDMMSVANALGIDIHTLNNMDHEELLNLLTQQAN
ncbi:palmitoleoyl-protein carboxylesterase NOTUM [Anabrus simplex]|uniref:palmitoleoyl-protein carboxylesterase NOTUM n=1 Tax=Anabrus simplex TaxID=316456 RepID=UPI0035A358FC